MENAVEEVATQELEKNAAPSEEDVEQLMVMCQRMVVEKNVAAPDEDVEQLHHLMEQLMVKVEQMKKMETSRYVSGDN